MRVETAQRVALAPDQPHDGGKYHRPLRAAFDAPEDAVNIDVARNHEHRNRGGQHRPGEPGRNDVVCFVHFGAHGRT
jgi:hypothetical protein